MFSRTTRRQSSSLFRFRRISFHFSFFFRFFPLLFPLRFLFYFFFYSDNSLWSRIISPPFLSRFIFLYLQFTVNDFPQTARIFSSRSRLFMWTVVWKPLGSIINAYCLLSWLSNGSHEFRRRIFRRYDEFGNDVKSNPL